MIATSISARGCSMSGAWRRTIASNEGKRRVHGCLVHIDIVDDKILIQRDGTERGMAPALARAGIAPERIVLTFHHAGPRPYSEFLAA